MGSTIVTLAKYKIKHKSYLGRLVLLNFLFLFFKWTLSRGVPHIGGGGGWMITTQKVLFYSLKLTILNTFE